MDQTLVHQFEQVYIDQKSLDSAVAERLFQFFPKNKIKVVSDLPPLPQLSRANEFSRSKKIIYVTKYSGAFFKRCPGATQKKALTCCNYYILNLGQQCPYDCSYCYLQSYLNSPVTLIYSNIEDALNELELMVSQHAHLPYRVGTGEVIDSLAFDELTLYSKTLIHFFKKYPHWTLEFKTKSNKVKQFLDCEHAQNVVVSWSINPQEIISQEEHRTASLKERLLAAQSCAQKKFPIALHIDPIIYTTHWKDQYRKLIEQVANYLSPKQTQVISLGALRIQPEQRHIMRERFGMNLVNQAELFPSEGSKLRYDHQLRSQMFQFVIEEFKKNSPEWKIFLCMETPETWLNTLNTTPMSVDELRPFFRPLPKNTKIQESPPSSQT